VGAIAEFGQARMVAIDADTAAAAAATPGQPWRCWNEERPA